MTTTAAVQEPRWRRGRSGAQLMPRVPQARPLTLLQFEHRAKPPSVDNTSVTAGRDAILHPGAFASIAGSPGGQTLAPR